jgi:hypothetical protein
MFRHGALVLSMETRPSWSLRYPRYLVAYRRIASGHRLSEMLGDVTIVSDRSQTGCGTFDLVLARGF